MPSSLEIVSLTLHRVISGMNKPRDGQVKSSTTATAVLDVTSCTASSCRV